MEHIINIRNLSKTYGQVQALDQVDLSIPRGKIIGLLGKNGAGKSTMLKCMLNFLRYNGDIEFFEKNIKEWNYELHQKVAFIPDVSGLDPRLTVQETIDFAAGINPKFDREKAKRLFNKSELPCNQKVKTLSKGMKTKLYLLLTLAKDVDVLLLDEPTLGLDIVFRQEFYDLFLGEFFNETKTVIISTHQVAEIENILNEVIFLDKGKVLAYEDIQTLKESWKTIELPADRKQDLAAMNVHSIIESLGTVKGVVENPPKSEDAHIGIPTISDIFIAMLEQGEA